MPEAFSTPNLVALPITSQELGRGGGFFGPQTKIVLSNSLTTIGLKSGNFLWFTQYIVVHTWPLCSAKILVGKVNPE